MFSRAHARTTGVSGFEGLAPNRALGTRCWRGSLSRDAALDWSGRPVPHGRQRQDGQASSVLTFGPPTRPKKPAPSLL